MPQFAANISLLYPEHAFLDRFAAAARDGFKAVEFLFPYEYEAADIAARLDAHGLRQVLFNAWPGSADAGERGLAILPGHEAAFRESIERALDYAGALACPRIHVMAGLAPAGAARDALRTTYLERLRWAAALAAKQGVDILIEPLNLRDNPGYFLNRQDEAHQLVADAGAPNLKVQFDLYHCQIAEGDLATRIRQSLPSGRVGHIQIAGVPERHEPDVGELNYPYLFDALDAAGYTGWIGCEYRPRAGAVPGGTTAGLGWAKRWLV